jgi:hypothetical protein
MKSLKQLIAELDALRHSSARELVQKIVGSLNEIERRLSALERMQSTKGKRPRVSARGMRRSGRDASESKTAVPAYIRSRGR